MHEVLVNRLGGLSLLTKSVVRLADRLYMPIDVYRGHKQQHNNNQKKSETEAYVADSYLEK